MLNGRYTVGRAVTAGKSSCAVSVAAGFSVGFHQVEAGCSAVVSGGTADGAGAAQAARENSIAPISKRASAC